MRFRALALSLLVFVFSCRDPGIQQVRDCGKPCYAYDAGEDIGLCQSGIVRCEDDGGSSCEGQVGPVTETCDGQDNNCNGKIDDSPVENFSGCENECGGGYVYCEHGRTSCIGQEPKTEVCNRLDDNCDGLVDNISYEYCYSADAGTLGDVCHPGVFKCVGVQRQCVGEQTPTPETCNSIDDNCNGEVDDGIPCTRPRGLTVTLSWVAPSDIDLHVRNSRSVGDPWTFYGWGATSYPRDGGSTFYLDCFYANKDPIWSSDSRENPHLDIDDLVGPGPETTVIETMSQADSYFVGVQVFTWKTTIPVAVTAKIYCGGSLLRTRTHLLVDRQFWVVGRAYSDSTTACGWVDDTGPDGGVDGGTIF